MSYRDGLVKCTPVRSGLKPLFQPTSFPSERAASPRFQRTSDGHRDLAQGSPRRWRWTFVNCVASGSWNGGKAASGTETDTAATAGTNTYVLQCSSAGGAASNSVTLTVNPKSGDGRGSLDTLTLLAMLGSLRLASGRVNRKRVPKV
jgi:hypothetical protein